MDSFFCAHLSTEEFDGPVGNHLVRIHVGLGAAARLPDDQGEVVVELPLDHLVSRSEHCPSFGLGEKSEVLVGIIVDKRSPIFLDSVR